MISAELLITFTFSVHVNFLTNKLFKGAIAPSKEYGSLWNDALIRRITVYGGHFWFEFGFFQSYSISIKTT